MMIGGDPGDETTWSVGCFTMDEWEKDWEKRMDSSNPKKWMQTKSNYFLSQMGLQEEPTELNEETKSIKGKSSSKSV
jgi:hypothetical protein